MTALALIAFAANSVLSRMALIDSALDAASFTAIRLLSGVAMLFIIMACIYLKKRRSQASSMSPPGQAKGKTLSAVMLFLYAVTFSYAYNYLDAGSGALILFGMVQITLFGYALYKRTPISIGEWLGMLLAFTGLIILVWPSLGEPILIGVLLMALSGVAWAGYTLMGADSSNPLGDTAFNFLRTVPMVIVLMLLHAWYIDSDAGNNISAVLGVYGSSYGVWLAVLSGAIASGVGYTLWYAVVPVLPKSVTAVVQLLVPVIAAFGGAMFTFEPLTLHLLLAMVCVSAGVVIVTWCKYRQPTHA